MADEERRTKRSRFDQTEAEPRRSRFDRRSRSPAARHSETRRSRSPIDRNRDGRSPSSKASTPLDPAAAAAAAAARINAQLQAKKGIQHVDVPPIQASGSPSGAAQSPSAGDGKGVNGEVYIADGDYIKDIEINDLRNRYTLTKGSTQKMIKEETGADVTTRGNYYPDKSMATAANPPLFLHVTSTTKAGLDKAIEKIDELMKQELPNLVDERRFRRREPEQQVERDEFGRRKWPEERISVDLEPIPGFNLRAQVVGHGGVNVKHIQQETRCRVQIKGRGSGFMEHGTGAESDEPMYLHVVGPDPNEVQNAKKLCEDLLGSIREQYEQFKANPPPQRGYGGDRGYGDRGGYGRNNDRGGYNSGGYGDRGNYGDRNNYQNDRHNSHSYSGHNSPAPAAPAAATDASATDLAAQYAAYYAQNPSADPYAAYGGYQNYLAYYQYYQAAAQQQQQQQAPPPPPSSEAPPPPPPGAGSASSPPPPPPPPGAPGAGSYSAVPPPPGM